MHTRDGKHVMISHTLEILRIDVSYVNQCVAQLIFSTIGVCTDHGIDGLVTHRVDMHRDTLRIRLARDVRQFLFSPVGETLMSVGIERFHIAGTTFHRAVHEELEPVRSNADGGVFLDVGGFFRASSTFIQLSTS